MKLFVREWGSGDKNAVLIHGFASSSHTWIKVAEKLAADGYHVFAPDLRGHGNSPRGNYSSVKDWVNDVLESVPANPTLAIGHSWGGLVLSEALSRLNPAKSIFVDPAWFIPAFTVGFARRALFNSGRWSKEKLTKFHPEWLEEDIDLEVEALNQWDRSSLKAITGGVTKPILSEFLKTHWKSSLTVIPRRSWLLPKFVSNKIARAGVKVNIVGFNHMIHRDSFEDFMLSVRSFA